MKSNRLFRIVAFCMCLSVSAGAQVSKILIPAGTPEDRAIQAFTSEADEQKRLVLIQDFLQKFSSNPQAVAFGNWQLAQSYSAAGDNQKALEYGDKALAAMPDNLDILVSLAGIAQQAKNNQKVMKYAAMGAKAFDGIPRPPKPEGVSDKDFAARIADENRSERSNYDYLESAAYNTIVADQEPKLRMQCIEQFTAAFPGSGFQEHVIQYAIYTLQTLNDPKRLAEFADKALAADPDNVATLALIASAFAEDENPASSNKAVVHARKAIELAKAKDFGADKSRKMSAGVAYLALGLALIKQEKTSASIPEFKSASELLKEDSQAYSTALYRLGYAYAKLNRVAEAKAVLTEAVAIESPVQQSAKDLLAKVTAAKTAPATQTKKR